MFCIIQCEVSGYDLWVLKKKQVPATQLFDFKMQHIAQSLSLRVSKYLNHKVMEDGVTILTAEVIFYCLCEV